MHAPPCPLLPSSQSCCKGGNVCGSVSTEFGPWKYHIGIHFLSLRILIYVEAFYYWPVVTQSLMGVENPMKYTDKGESYSHI